MVSADNIGLMMGVVSFIGGVTAWYSAAVKKNYAAERDFNHLKRNYQQLSHNMGELDKHMDDRLDRLQHELTKNQALLMAMSARILGTESNVFRE